MKKKNSERLNGGFGPLTKRGAFTFLAKEKTPATPNQALLAPGPRLVCVNGVNDFLIGKIR